MYFLAINTELIKIKVNKYNTWLLFTQKYFFCNYLFTYPICTQPLWVLHSALLCTKSFLTKEESKWPHPTVQVRLTVNKETSWALCLWVICAHVTEQVLLSIFLPFGPDLFCASVQKQSNQSLPWIWFCYFCTTSQCWKCPILWFFFLSSWANPCGIMWAQYNSLKKKKKKWNL